MNTKFRPYVEQLERKLKALISMKPIKIDSLPTAMPQAGVYVFYEAGTPLYVGRTNKMKARLKYHSSGADDAPFAFRLAREETGQPKASYQQKGSRKDLLSKPKFRKAYADAKIRIRAMDIRFVEETDQVRQALLEIYMAVVLDTPHNDFKTH